MQFVLEVYTNAFPNSPQVTSEMVPMAPHCISLSLQSKESLVHEVLLFFLAMRYLGWFAAGFALYAFLNGQGGNGLRERPSGWYYHPCLCNNAI